MNFEFVVYYYDKNKYKNKNKNMLDVNNLGCLSIFNLVDGQWP